MEISETQVTTTREGIFRLVQVRRYDDIQSDYLKDDDGFVVHTKDVFPADELLKRQASLVLAPPWIGKSFVASALYRALTLIYSDEDEKPFGDFVHLTPFESFSGSGDSPIPPWWARWATSTSRACWIVDALDEGDQRSPGVSSFLLKKLADLGPASRSRLTVVIFCREAEVPPNTRVQLDQIFGENITYAQLLPLDKSSAQSFVGHSDFDRILDVIRRHALQHVASYPAVLKYLKGCPSDASFADVDIWKGVLSELLSVFNRLPLVSPDAEPELVFSAAARMAAAMSFSGVDDLAVQPTPGRHTVDDIISHQPLPGQPDRGAARQALRSDMFRHAGDSIRFVQRNVQDWMTVFAIREFRLNRIKPLLTTENGRIPPSAMGIARLLHRTTTKEEVRDWLTSMFGGVPPSSDSAPWSLADCIKVLNHLEEIAQSSDWRIRLSDEDGLKRLSVPGVGPVLASRLQDEKRALLAKLLILDVAIAIKSDDVVDPASNILLSSKTDSNLRRQAAHFIAAVADDNTLKSILKTLAKTKLATSQDKAAFAEILYSMRAREILSMEEAATMAPYPSDEAVDVTHILAHQMEENMTLAVAKHVVRHKTLFKGRTRKDNQKGRRLEARREYRVDQKVLELVAEQDVPDDKELKILVNLGLKFADADWFYDIERTIGQGVAKVQWARQDLYLRDLRRATNNRNAGDRTRRQWRWILTSQDIDWLLGVAPELEATEPEIWSELYELLYSPDTDTKTKNRVRKFLRERMTDALKQWDENRKNYAAKRRKWEERDRRREEERKAQEIGIAEAVSNVHQNKEQSLQQKLWNLSWICLSDDGHGPSNLVGEWKDLSQETRKSVLDICHRALRELDPTPFPDGNTFPAVVAYEADAFRHVITELGDDVVLDGDMIRKWLPSFLKGAFGNKDQVLTLCFEADSRATEDVIIAAMNKEARQETPHWSLAAYLPDAFWTESFVLAVRKIVVDASLDVGYRASALRTLCEKLRGDVLPLLHSILGKKGAIEPPTDLLWATALNACLALDTDAAWPLSLTYIERHGKPALTSLRSLYDRDSRLNTSILSWPAKRLGELLDILSNHFPPDKDPDYRTGMKVSVGSDFHLRDLRQNIPWRMYERGGADDLRVLDDLAKKHKALRDEYAYIKARAGVSDFLAFAAMSEGQRRRGYQLYPRLDRVVRLLDDESYRLIRSADDLQRVILEALERIALTAAKHLPMLYLPEEISGGTKRRHEEAFQLYIQCRLRDLLPDKILERETEVKYRRRQDIKVVAPQIDSKYATIVIEVKWTDNKEISTSLIDQLGAKYLLAESETHGIYLVGWNGSLKWRKCAGKRPKTKDCPTALVDYLEKQAATFSASNPGHKIDSIVFDLAWP